jgi:hypothetical protein
MKKMSQLSDFDHPSVIQKAKELTQKACNEEEKIRNIFLFVRDDIQFGFPDKGDFVTASETMQLGYGQCNTKSTLFLALCKASNIKARIHFSLIKKEIQRGLITGLLYRLIPKNISHSWIEIMLNDRWVRIDSFINDKPFYEAGKSMLIKNNWDTGFSVACSKNASSIDLDLSDPKFVQMDAVTQDHGVYDEPMLYYCTSQYKNRPNPLTLLIYRLLIKSVNNRVRMMRESSVHKHCVCSVC